MAKLTCLSLTAALVIAGCFAVACGGGGSTNTSTPTAPSPASSPDATSAASGTVNVSDNKFSPASLTVGKGAKVTWNWSGKNPHSIDGTFDGKNVHSPTKTGTGTFSLTFNTPGTYNYYCSVHGKSMSATIRVQ